MTFFCVSNVSLFKNQLLKLVAFVKVAYLISENGRNNGMVSRFLVDRYTDSCESR